MKMTEQERLQWMQRRPRESLFWAIVHALGSLKMAVFLMLVLLVMSAFGAVYESWSNNRLAQAHVYKAPWFLVWIVALAVNLVAVTLTRWPWQRKHTAFIVTHYGIVVILAGAFVGMIWGKEGFVTLQVGDSTRQLNLKEKVLFVQGLGQSGFFVVPFDAEVAGVGPKRPWSIDLRSGGMRVSVVDYRKDLVLRERLLEDFLQGDGPGVEIQLISQAMEGKVPMVMVLNNWEQEIKRDVGGLMSVCLARKLPLRDVGTPTAERVPVREIWMVFEKAQHSPLVHTEDPYRSGWWVWLERVEGLPVLKLRNAAGLEEEFRVADLQNGTVKLADGVTHITLRNYWRNLVLEEGEPTEGPPSGYNPAALFWLETVVLPPEAKQPQVLVSVVSDSHIVFEASKDGVVTATGQLQEGGTADLGWGSWSLQLVSAAQRGVVVFEPTTAESANASAITEAEAVSGIQVVLQAAGMSSEPTWVATGSSARVMLGGQLPVTIGYGHRIHRLPFSVELKAFDVPRDEGTDTPANFISQLVFTDLRTGESVQDVAKMNHPACYPPQWWRRFVGNVYKFSQAGWDPQNLQKSTLQVLYDPGWMLKWVGSLMLCTGIFLMFYQKPHGRTTQSRCETPPVQRQQASAAMVLQTVHFSSNTHYNSTAYSTPQGNGAKST